MGTPLKILYRGPLSSCNYGCEYCPFAKREESREELEKDRLALERFLKWVERETREIAILFTPWGEALVRPWYQDALVRLTRMPHVSKAAIQTNLAASLAWVAGAEISKLGIWATFHPEWANRDRFLEKVRALHERGVSISVGMVGFTRFRAEIEAMRATLPSGVYLWINAVKSAWEQGPPETYGAEDFAFLESIDPLFPVNAIHHRSLGEPCRAGATAISVDGDGTVRRCHFVREPIGNLDTGFTLAERSCVNETCGCHIGYVHLDRLGLDATFGAGLLERVPTSVPPRALRVLA